MSERLWEYRGYWIRRLGNSTMLYACWYDGKRRREARRSLGTEVLADAQDRLIELVGSASASGSRSPDSVMILAVCDHYYENDVKAKPSSAPAKRAIGIMTEFLVAKSVPGATVSTFGPVQQRAYMKWCREEFGHSPSTIARNLSVVSSAFRFSKRLTVVLDGLGNEREVQLLDSAPDVVNQASAVAKYLGLPEPRAREWTPSLEEFGRFIDAIDARKENLFRFVIMALNTWARPEAIVDLRVDAQVDFTKKLLDLNPPGRRQNKKFRPRIPLTDNLAAWLKHWNMDSPLAWDGQAIGVIKKSFKRHAVACGLDRFTQGTIRHFMATQVKAIRRPRVTAEQRDEWLGHVDQRTANFYEAFDPDFLRECRIATEKVIEGLQKHTSRPLSARKLRASVAVSSDRRTKRNVRKALQTKRSDGGRDKDRTCDPYDVNVVLSR